MSKLVLSEKQLHEIEVAIYNDDNEALYKTLPNFNDTVFNQEVIKELVEKQPYYIIPESTILLRKDGLIINFKTLRTIKPQFTPRDIILNIKSKMIRMSDIFIINNWPWDREQVLRRYKSNNWKIGVQPNFRTLWEEL